MYNLHWNRKAKKETKISHWRYHGETGGNLCETLCAVCAEVSSGLWTSKTWRSPNRDAYRPRDLNANRAKTIFSGLNGRKDEKFYKVQLYREIGSKMFANI